MSKPELTILTFKWGGKFSYLDANRVAGMVERYFKRPHRFVCITDRPEGVTCETYPLWLDLGDIPNPTAGRPSCFRRLKLFDPDFAARFGDNLMWIDLDTILVNDVTDLWTRDEDWIAWRDPAYRPKGQVSAYNGSMVKWRRGVHRELWDDFDGHQSVAEIKAAGIKGSDQAWFHIKLGLDMPVWTALDGVLWSRQCARHLPEKAKIVFFSGEHRDRWRLRWARERLF